LEEDPVRGEAIAEVGSSLVMSAITGVCTFGGFAFADYAFLPLHSSLKAVAMILLLFGAVNLPLFIIWTRLTAHEVAAWAASSTADRMMKNVGGVAGPG
jgi:hypothetical protein